MPEIPAAIILEFSIENSGSVFTGLNIVISSVVIAFDSIIAPPSAVL